MKKKFNKTNKSKNKKPQTDINLLVDNIVSFIHTSTGKRPGAIVSPYQREMFQ